MGVRDIATIKVRPDLPYMTGPEARLFAEQVVQGRVSFFRIAVCQGRRKVDGGQYVVCGKDIYKTKEYCCLECYNSRKVGEDGGDDSTGTGESGSGDTGEG